MEFHYDGNSASEATTWVCKASSDLSVPYYNDALEDAVKKGVFIGLHKDTRSFVVHWLEPQTAQAVRRKLQTILGKGGAAKKVIQSVEAFDLFHAESWGMIKVDCPDIPEPLVEEDDLDEELMESDEFEELQEPEELEPEDADAGGQQMVVAPDLFALAVAPAPESLVVPGLLTALGTQTAEQEQLRAAFEKAGGPLSDYLENALFSRGMGHVREVQGQTRALAKAMPPKESIFWVSGKPPFLTVYTKPNMHMSRRVDWIVWKAAQLELELTLPVFMALFKQTGCIRDDGNRLTKFKEAVVQWKGSLQWKALSNDERNLIRNINQGVEDYYCRGCRRVLSPNSTSEFCSSHCAKQFCPCGSKFQSRRVVDSDRLEQSLDGCWALRELAEMLRTQEEVELYPSLVDIDDKFRECSQRRAAEKCCRYIQGFVDGSWCQKCKQEEKHLVAIQKNLGLIRSGQVTWGHCEEAARSLKALADKPPPTKEQLFCEACEPARKRQRV